jgi:hypothetical protein
VTNNTDLNGFIAIGCGAYKEYSIKETRIRCESCLHGCQTEGRDEIDIGAHGPQQRHLSPGEVTTRPAQAGTEMWAAQAE